jgi:hypothetical protein
MGSYQILRSVFKDEDKFVEIFKSGKRLSWDEHHHDLFVGQAKFGKPLYMNNLVSSRTPSLDGVQEKLKEGTKIANIGCGIWCINYYYGKGISKFKVLWL